MWEGRGQAWPLPDSVQGERKPANRPHRAIQAPPARPTVSPIVVQAEATFADAIHQLERHGCDAVAVVGHDGRAIGLLTMTELEREPHDGYATLVGDIADRDPNLFVTPSLDGSLLLDNMTFLGKHHATVVDLERRPIGNVSETDILRTIRVRKLAASDKRELIHHS